MKAVCDIFTIGIYTGLKYKIKGVAIFKIVNGK